MSNLPLLVSLPAWETIAEYLDDPLYLYGGAAVLVLLVAILLVIINFFLKKTNNRILAFKTGDGVVEVTPAAVRSLIMTACTGVDGVETARSSFGMRRGSLHIRVRIHLRASHPLGEVEQLLRRRIRDSLTSRLGIQKIAQIHVIVDRIIGTPPDYPFEDRERAVPEHDEPDALLDRFDEPGDDERPRT